MKNTSVVSHRKTKSMSQVQILEHSHQKTFEDICPNFSKTISIWDSLTDQEKAGQLVLMKDKHNCIVAEAHSGSEIMYDGCGDCFHFGIKFSDAADNWIVFEQVKDNFVQHWNSTHVSK